jgi:uncharacterized membrane protein
MASGVQARGTREPWLDAMRGLAVLGMIETHTVNTVLAEEWRSGEGFTRLVYGNGLVAPAFLWIAGQAHGLASGRRLAGGVWPVRTVRRLLTILALGYLIHLPVPGTGATWRHFFGIDVLQCLAVSLLFVVVVERWAPRPRADVVLGLLGLGLLAVGALPSEALNSACPFWPLEAWIDQSGRSLFPLVPWAAFVFFGVVMAYWRLPWWACGVMGVVLLALPSPPFISKSHPTFFAERFGWLLLGASVIHGLGRVVPMPRWLCWMGRESLGLYVAHLALLYLVPTARWIGPNLGPVGTGAVAAGLVAASVGLVWGWRRASGRAGERKERKGRDQSGGGAVGGDVREGGQG